jgi:hypothetical protein
MDMIMIEVMKLHEKKDMVLINMGDENKAIDGYDINKEYGA